IALPAIQTGFIAGRLAGSRHWSRPTRSAARLREVRDAVAAERADPDLVADLERAAHALERRGAVDILELRDELERFGVVDGHGPAVEAPRTLPRRLELLARDQKLAVRRPADVVEREVDRHGLLRHAVALPFEAKELARAPCGDDHDVAAVCEHVAVCAGNLRARNRRDG